ncbi:MAG: hypothetical protein EOO40_08610, partial [Deltaproteobacteria bacterium]
MASGSGSGVGSNNNKPVVPIADNGAEELALRIKLALNSSGSNTAAGAQSQLTASNNKLANLADTIAGLVAQQQVLSTQVSNDQARLQGLQQQRPIQAAGQSDKDYQAALKKFAEDSPHYDSDVANAQQSVTGD